MFVRSDQHYIPVTKASPCSTYLLYGLQQVLLVWGAGRDAAMAAQLQRGHEHAHGALLVFREAVSVVVQHLVQIQGQLRSVLRGGRAAKRTKFGFCSEKKTNPSSMKTWSRTHLQTWTEAFFQDF